MVLLPDLSNTCHVTAKVYLVQLEHLSQAPLNAEVRMGLSRKNSRSWKMRTRELIRVPQSTAENLFLGGPHPQTRAWPPSPHPPLHSLLMHLLFNERKSMTHVD